MLAEPELDEALVGGLAKDFLVRTKMRYREFIQTFLLRTVPFTTSFTARVSILSCNSFIAPFDWIILMLSFIHKDLDL